MTLTYLPFTFFPSLGDLSSGVPQLATVTPHHFSFSPATFAFQTQLAVAKPSIATSQPADIEKIQQKQQQGAKRKRNLRTMFTKKQLEGLELKFAVNKYLSVPDRMELAARLELSKTQVKTWFQNRRWKCKKQQVSDSQKKYDQESLSSCIDALSPSRKRARFADCSESLSPSSSSAESKLSDICFDPPSPHGVQDSDLETNF